MRMSAMMDGLCLPRRGREHVRYACKVFAICALNKLFTLNEWPPHCPTKYTPQFPMGSDLPPPLGLFTPYTCLSNIVYLNYLRLQCDYYILFHQDNYSSAVGQSWGIEPKKNKPALVLFQGVTGNHFFSESQAPFVSIY